MYMFYINSIKGTKFLLLCDFESKEEAYARAKFYNERNLNVKIKDTNTLSTRYFYYK